MQQRAEMQKREIGRETDRQQRASRYNATRIKTRERIKHQRDEKRDESPQSGDKATHHRMNNEADI